MGIYTRRDSPFYWMLLEHTGQKCSTGVVRDAADAMSRKLQRQAAEDVYRARMTDLARRAAGLPPEQTIAFAPFAKWYQTHHTAKHRGRDREIQIIATLVQHFGRYDLMQITSALVSEYETQRIAAKVKPRSVNRETDVLKAMLKAAIPTYLTASPLTGRKLLRVVKPRKRVLTAEEETRLLAELPARDRPFFIVAVDTLIRLSNVIDLTRAEDKGTHLALVDSKTGPYDVPLSSRARAALDGIPKTGPYYFPHRRTAKTMRDTRRAIARLLERACKRCDPPIPYGRAIAGITFHTATRATGATRMLHRGADPKTVQEIGNWASLEQMGEYLLTDEQRKRQAVELIGRAEITPPSRNRKPPKKRQSNQSLTA